MIKIEVEFFREADSIYRKLSILSFPSAEIKEFYVYREFSVSLPNYFFPQIRMFYQGYLESRDLSRFIADVAECYTQGTLERLASCHLVSVRRAAILALTSLGDFRANRVLAEALRDEDSVVAVLAETGIKTIWQRDFSRKDQASLQQIAQAVQTGNTTEAISLASEQIFLTPGFAEVWYLRGNAWLLRGNYFQAAADYQRVLELNPYHFQAATKLGTAQERLGEVSRAREAFRRSLRINPGLKQSRKQLKQLAKAK